MPLPAIMIHGGAWAIPQEYSKASVDGVKAAAIRGYQVMKAGGSAVDAVEAAVVVMEDDTVFDAGTGSVLNANGDIEMDSVIMNGNDLKLGAVASVQNIENPVKLARKVMEETEHTMLVGAGANQYAEQIGVPRVPTDKLVTEEAKKEFERYLQFKTAVDVSFRFQGSGCETVGAAAVDSDGNVAFATSTGGITAKRPGRVGDSPLVGCGGYADNESGAASTTGHGESISKVCLAYRCLDLVKQGKSGQSAAEEGIQYMAKRVKGTGGIVMVTKDGDFGFHFNTERMAWASLSADTINYGIDPGENHTEKL